MSSQIIINTQQALLQKQEKIAALEAKNEKEIRELNVQLKAMGENVKKLEEACKEDTKQILEAIKNRG